MKAGSQWRLVALDRCRDTTAIMQISSTADHSSKMTLISERRTSRDPPSSGRSRPDVELHCDLFKTVFIVTLKVKAIWFPAAWDRSTGETVSVPKLTTLRGNIRGRIRRGPLKKGKQRER